MDLQSMPVDILEHILLRLDSPSCLIRASCTCKQWRRIISGTVFLKRIRLLHEPPVAAGSYNNNQILPPRPRFEPSSTTIGSKYLSLDFLPENRGYTWRTVDSRGSLVLLKLYFTEKGIQHEHMAVCEPLTQRYEKIPQLAASPEYQRGVTDAFLLAGAKPGATDMSNFRLVYLSRRDGMVGVLTSGGSWRKLSIGNVRANKMICMGFAAGSMYWYTNRGKVYSLDASAATFSSSSLPGVEDFSKLMIFSKFAVTTGRDGKARILFLGAGNNLKIFANRKGGRDWVLEKTLQLSAEMLGVSSNQNLFLNRSVPLSAETVGMVRIVASMGQLTISAAAYLDIDTSQLERTAESKEYFPIKLPWPKSLHALH